MNKSFFLGLSLVTLFSVNAFAGNCTSGFVETAKITINNNMSTTALSNGTESNIDSKYYGWKTKPPSSIAAQHSASATVGFCCNALSDVDSSKSAYIQYDVGSNGICNLNFEVKCDRDHEYLKVNTSSCTTASLATKNSDPNISYTVKDLANEETSNLDLDSE
jgi:hypothetical protein